MFNPVGSSTPAGRLEAEADGGGSGGGGSPQEVFNTCIVTDAHYITCFCALLGLIRTSWTETDVFVRHHCPSGIPEE